MKDITFLVIVSISFLANGFLFNRLERRNNENDFLKKEVSVIDSALVSEQKQVEIAWRLIKQVTTERDACIEQCSKQ